MEIRAFVTSLYILYNSKPIGQVSVETLDALLLNKKITQDEYDYIVGVSK